MTDWPLGAGLASWACDQLDVTLQETWASPTHRVAEESGAAGLGDSEEEAKSPLFVGVQLSVGDTQ